MAAHGWIRWQHRTESTPAPCSTCCPLRAELSIFQNPRSGCMKISMPALLRDLAVLCSQLSAGEANNPNHETFAGEYRKTGHCQACPTGNHFVRTRLEQIS